MRIRIFAYALSLIIFSGFFFLSCNRQQEINQKYNTFASLSDTTRYIGKEACKQCHSDKFESFMHTGMGMSFDTASHAKSSGHFDSHEVIYDKFRNFSYYPHWEGNSLFITEFRMNGKDTSYSRKEKISYIVGSGQHTNSHLINVNGYIYQAPATFYTQSGKWDLPPGFENGFNNRFSRLIELECMSCHNAYPKIELGSANKYISVPDGIDCERCHGPGSVHRQEMLDGKIVDVKTEIDFTIVNPSKLDISRQLDVCQRCHVQGNAVLRKGKSFFDFKPGMHLSEVMNIFMPVYKGDDEEHIMASHAERMKLSECFTASLKIVEKYNASHPTKVPYKNTMTCVTCHNPHISVKSTGKEVFNTACRNCHASEKESKSNLTVKIVSSKECSADMKLRELQKDNCVGCHMPKNGTIDIPHVTSTDHWIRKQVSMESKKRIREFVKLACINNSDVDDKSKGIAYLSYFEKFVSNKVFLDSAKKYFSDDSKTAIVENFSELVRWAFLKEDYALIIHYVMKHGNAIDSLNEKSYSNDDAWTAYRIGQSFRIVDDKPNSLRFFMKAVDLAPLFSDFRIKLADLQFELGDITSAERNYEFIIKETPNYVSAYVNYGFMALSAKQNSRLADDYYNKALLLDPDNEQALLNKAGLMIYKKEFLGAKSMLEKVLKINPLNSQAKRLIKVL